MKTKVRIQAGGLTTLRSARQLVKRGRARWIGEGEGKIAIIAADNSEPPMLASAACLARSAPRHSPRFAVGYEPAGGRKLIGTPALPIIGYDRRSGVGRTK